MPISSRCWSTRCNLDRFVLVGHSMGGAVAWTFAATRPDRVSQLILVDAAGYPRTAARRRCRRGSRACRWSATSASTSSPSGWCGARSAEVYADPAMVTPERVKRYAELQRFPGNREATLQRARTQEPLDPTPLKRLDVPTLILWGAQGPLGADRRRLPLPERHQGREARDLREARPQPDGRGSQGDRRRGRRLPDADPPPAAPPIAAADRRADPARRLDRSSGVLPRRGPGEGSSALVSSSAITLAKACVGDRLDLGLGAVLDGMGDVDDGGLEAQRIRFAPRRRRRSPW